MRRIVPAGFEDEESDSGDEFLLPKSSNKRKAQQACLLSAKKTSYSSKVKVQYIATLI